MTRNRAKKKPRSVTKSVGAVILSPDNRFLLVFQSRGQFWEFPKGKIEPGEETLETMKREIEEETGITNFTRLEEFDEKIYFHFYLQDGTRIDREVLYYLIRTQDDGNVRISEEHKDFTWETPKKAIALLQHQNHKDLVRKVVKHLEVQEV